MRSLRRRPRSGGTPDTLTPTSANLLRWWFDPEFAEARGGLAFDAAQQQAIQHTVVRHEGAAREYRVAPPRHRLSLAPGAGRTPVLLALMLWQLFNHNDARAAGRNDPRFTRHFVVIAPQPALREHLMDALWGRRLDGGTGARDFGTAAWVRWARLLLPDARRDEAYAFMCASFDPGTTRRPTGSDSDLIVITGEGPQTPVNLARLPHVMVFSEESRCAADGRADGDAAANSPARKRLRRMVLQHGKPCMEVVFSHPDPNAL